MSDSPVPPPITLEQFCRALAAHLLLSSHGGSLHDFRAPEIAEDTAQYIHRFALGEELARPKPRPAENDQS
jgi:hypothetical protein